MGSCLADFPTNNIDDNGIFKALVGEDYLTVEKKNKNPFFFQSTARLLFSCNSIPKNYGDKSEEFYRRLMGNHYVFSETEKNRAELQQYREESDYVLSFVKEHCIVLPEGEGSVGSTELFNAYKGYCEECGLKPYSQKSFVQQMMTSFPHLERKIDRIAKRRVLTGIKLGEILM